MFGGQATVLNILLTVGGDTAQSRAMVFIPQEVQRHKNHILFSRFLRVLQFPVVSFLPIKPIP